MVAKAIKLNHNDIVSILTLARYAGLRLEECLRIDRNDTEIALLSGKLFVKSKGGLTRYVPINESIKIVLKNTFADVKRGEKLFVRNDEKNILL